MRASNGNKAGRVSALKYGASMVVLGALAAAIAPAAALAQDASSTTSTGSSAQNPSTAGTVSEVVVTGVRASLATSQQIKRNADTVVDSITATDIGAFPDKSVAEALQRVAGITVDRFAADSDTSHFSAEPSGVIVRGLQQVRSEFNGRDIFNANSSRGLSFGDVSPELMAGVDSYKNETADMIEGGIAGTINLRTRLPFDSNGQQFAASVDENWGNLAREWRPDISALYSNRWDTPIGDIGIMADVAKSRVRTETEGMLYGRIGPYEGFNGAGVTPNYGKDLVWIPASVAARATQYDRDRTGEALAFQWRSPDRTMLLTGQYNASTYHNVWHERGVESYPGYGFYGNSVHYACTPTDAACGANSVEPQPAPGTGPFTFDNTGLFTSGVVTTGIGWWGADNTASSQFGQNAQGQPFVNACYGWNGCSPALRGPDFNTISRFNDNRETTSDASLNLKWDPTDDLHFNADYQHVHSHVENYDMEVDLYSMSNIGLTEMNGGAPSMTLLPPTNVNLSPGGLQNPQNYYDRSAMDHIEDSHGSEDAFRADAAYDFHTTWLDSLKVGVRYADRQQTVQWSGYNWANVANTWTSTGPGGIPQSAYFNITNTTPAGPFKGYPANLTEMGTLPSNFYGGGHINQTTFPFINYAIMSSEYQMGQALGAPSIGVGSWDPICSHTGTRVGELAGSCFLPGEIDQVDEKTKAAYIMLKFGGNDATVFGLRVSGNIGVRYVDTQDESGGGTVLPLIQPTNSMYACTPSNTAPPQPGQPVTPSTPYSVGCYLFGGNTTAATGSIPTGLPGQPQEAAFNSGAFLPNTAKAKHVNWLPSFNIKVNLTENWIVRFAASRAMSRPDMGYLKNYLGVSAAMPTSSNPVICSTSTTGIPCWTSTNGQISGITGVQPIYTATSYNPYLRPVTADQFDLTLEHYWGDVGQFTVDLFEKKFHDYIQFGARYQDVTANGVTRQVRVSGPINQGGATVKGMEVAFQRFADFLPAPWDGLGVQANFTYVKNSGLPNSNLSIVSSPGVTNSGVPDQLNPGSLEGLSKYSYNLIAMYEKGPWALRAAYNWRSTYLQTALDCCVYLPIWTKRQGFLDASARYKVNEHLEVSVEGTNLLNTKTILLQQVTDVTQGRQLLPASWFENDRRIQIGARFKY